MSLFIWLVPSQVSLVYGGKCRGPGYLPKWVEHLLQTNKLSVDDSTAEVVQESLDDMQEPLEDSNNL